MDTLIIQWSGTIETAAMHVSFTLVTVIFCFHMVKSEFQKRRGK